MSSPMSLSALSQEIGINGYIVTFVLGLVGHSCSLLTFSQRKLRSISTTFFFLSITICDMTYLFMSLYDFIFILLQVSQLSPYYISLCRFRTFIINFTQTASPWLLICLAFDRLIRTLLPYRTRQWCTHKNVFIAVFIVILCSVAFNSHVLQSSFITILANTRVICGPSRLNITDYTIFYYTTWPALQISINSVGPALLLIVSLIIIYRKVRTVAMVRPNQHLQNQMLFIILSKTILFLVCTLPYSAYRMAALYSLDLTDEAQYQTFLIVTALLTILLNANFSITFYINCLTSTLFRQTFVKTIKDCVRRHNTVQPAAGMPAVV